MDNKQYWLSFWGELDVFKWKKQDLLGKIAEDMYHCKSQTGEGEKLNKLKFLIGFAEETSTAEVED